MIIVAANSKGGVGKSTLAVHLAYWLYSKGKRVTLLDADPQASASQWMAEVSQDIRTVTLEKPDDILEQAPALDAESDYVIADAPAISAEVIRALLLVADLAILPCGASYLDVNAATGSIRVLRQAQKVRKDGLPKALFIQSKVQRGTRLERDLVETAGKLGIPVAQTTVYQRQVYADAPGQGTTVFAMKYRGKEAAEELDALFNEVLHGRPETVDGRENITGEAGVSERAGRESTTGRPDTDAA